LESVSKLTNLLYDFNKMISIDNGDQASYYFDEINRSSDWI